MENLVEYIVKQLVNQKEQVNITRVERDDATVIEVRVAQEDMGKIIGKQGKIAKAIRTVVKAASSKEEKRVIVDII
ncbi:MAG: KH domain-containing protein [Clostridiales bacterium]|nr:KH domain-containing protein [Clostridiales bacterium]